MRSKVFYYSLSAVSIGAVVAVVRISEPRYTWWTLLDLVVVLTVGSYVGPGFKLAVSTAVGWMTGVRPAWVNLPIGPAGKGFRLGETSVRLQWNAGWLASWRGSAGPRGTLVNAAAGPVAEVLISPLVALLPVRQPIAVGLAVSIGLGGLTMLVPYREPATGLWSPGARLFVPRVRSLTMFFGDPDWALRPDAVDRLLSLREHLVLRRRHVDDDGLVTIAGGRSVGETIDRLRAVVVEAGLARLAGQAVRPAG